MSADSWTICPKCFEQDRIEAERHILRATEAYGKVSPEEYIAIVREIDKIAELEENLAERWEIGMCGKANFFVKYYCECDKCGWNWAFERRIINVLAGDVK